MWRTIVDFLMHFMQRPLNSSGFLAITIAGLGVIAFAWRLRSLYDRDRRDKRKRLTPALARSIPRSAPPRAHTRIPHESGRPFDPAMRRLPPSSAPDFDSNDSTSRVTSPLSASAFSMPAAFERARSGSARSTPGDDAPEDTIAPPIWRRVEALLDEHRAATLALTGEALGEAVLIEPAAPIWRGVSALRIEAAESEGAPEAAELETTYACASPPPIWRAERVRERLALALDTARGDHRDHDEHGDDDLFTQPITLSEPPIWTSWVLRGWPETRALSGMEAVADAQAPAIWSEPPIWSSAVRPR